MDTHASEEFSACYETCRIKVEECVHRLFRYGAQSDQLLDVAIADLIAVIKETLEADRASSRAVSRFCAPTAEFSRDGLIGTSLTDLDDSITELDSPLSSPLTDVTHHPWLRFSSILTSVEGAEEQSPSGRTQPDSSDEITFRLSTSSPAAREESEGLGNRPVDAVMTRTSDLRATRLQIQRDLSDNRWRPLHSTRVLQPITFGFINDTVGLTGGQDAFEAFRDAIAFIHDQKVLRLPREGESVATIFTFLRSVQGAHSASQLLYRTASWRFLKRYYDISDRKDEERRGWTTRQKRINKAGRATSQARVMLINQGVAQDGTSSTQIEKSAVTKLDNQIESSKVWYEVCELGGSAMVGMLPTVAHTR